MARPDLGTFKKSGIPILHPKASVFGDTWFVDSTDGNDEYTGQQPTNAHATLGQAVDYAGAAGVNATIVVRKGYYQPASTLALDGDHNDLRIISDNLAPLMGRNSNIIYCIGYADPFITLNGAHNVEIAGFRIYCDMGAASVGINIADTSAAYGTWIHDNMFYNVETDFMATSIRMGGTGAAAYTLVEDNFFYCGGDRTNTKGVIDWTSAIWSCVRRNLFHLISNFTTNSGINMSDAAAPRGWILDNHFCGVEIGVSAQVTSAIYAANAMDAGDFHISGNFTTNLAAPFASNIIASEVFGMNYLNHAVVAAT